MSSSCFVSCCTYLLFVGSPNPEGNHYPHNRDSLTVDAHSSRSFDFGGIKTAPTNLVSAKRKLNVAAAFA